MNRECFQICVDHTISSVSSETSRSTALEGTPSRTAFDCRSRVRRRASNAEAKRTARRLHVPLSDLLLAATAAILFTVYLAAAVKLVDAASGDRSFARKCEALAFHACPYIA